jgi:hypothetical protein
MAEFATEPPAPARRTPVVADLVALFFRPARFFADIDLDHRWWYLPALLAAGVTSASGRVDQNLMREDLGQARAGWETLAPYLVESWPTLWAFLLGAGAIYAVGYWYIGGWWYKVRLRWSGAEAPDPRTARLVMVTAGIVTALPALIYMLGQTAVYPSYRAAWNSDDLLSVSLVLFPFWSVYASYRGVRTRFDVAKWKSRLWFLILPAVVFAFVFGVIAILYAVLVAPLTTDAGPAMAGLLP